MIWQIEALRGLAAGIVVVAHSIIYAHSLPGFEELPINYYIKYSGAFGVDLFFVISGLVISKSWHNNNKNANIFLMGRLKRVYLPFLLVAFFAVIISTLRCLSNDAAIDYFRIIKTIILYPQFNDNGHSLSYVGVSWTLTYEFIFYAIFSIAIKLNRRAPEIVVSALLLVLVLVGFVSERSNEFIFNSIQMEFIFGILISRYVLSEHFDGKVIIIFGFFLMIAALVYIAFFQWEGFEDKFKSDRFLVLGSLATGLIIVSIKYNFKDLWIFDALKNLGGVSYSIYLVHFVIAFPAVGVFWKYFYSDFSRDFVEQYSGIIIYFIVTILCVVSYLLSVIFNLYIEKRLISR